MSAGIFARVIAPQEFALGLSQLGTDGSNPVPSREESANHRFLSPHACDRRRRGQGEPFGTKHYGFATDLLFDPCGGARVCRAGPNPMHTLRSRTTSAQGERCSVCSVI